MSGSAYNIDPSSLPAKADWKRHQYIRTGINNATDKHEKRNTTTTRPASTVLLYHQGCSHKLAVAYLIRRGDDVDTDNLFSQDRLGVDAAESASEFCVLGQGLNGEKCNAFTCRTGMGHFPLRVSSRWTAWL